MKKQNVKCQTPTISVGTGLNCGKVVAITNKGVMINDGSKVKLIDFKTAESNIFKGV